MDKKSKRKFRKKSPKPKRVSSIKLDVESGEQADDQAGNVEQSRKPSTDVVCPGNAAALTAGTATSTPASSSGKGNSKAMQKEKSKQQKAARDPYARPEGANSARGNWAGRFDFLLSLLGYSVGLGNVWRFPYLCYNNGGGAFLIPFTIMLIIAGLPLMFMELSFGQYAALGPVAVYRRFCPLFSGLGTGMVIVSAVVMLYYNLIIAWTLFYMFASFSTVLPWEKCHPEWSTLHCFSYVMADQCEAINGTYYLRTCYNASFSESHNLATLAMHVLKRSPAEEYFNNYVLGLSSGIEETGTIRWSLAACLLIAWIIVFLCLCKGVQSSGKVVYFTALFPYLVLVILFVRGVTLPGASTGLLFYLMPDWKQLTSAQVWGDAAVQIFFALSPSWGGLITLSSYNKFSNNCYKDAMIVAFCNIATSFFAGLVIFSIIGFLAHELDVEVKKVVDQGAGLAFIVYPEVVTRLPISPVWSVLFFLMLLTLGLDSQFALMETVTTAISDQFPKLRKYKTWVVLFVGILGYIGGLGFTTNSGMYWLQLMDKYAANWSVLLIAITECVLIAWVYGSQRFLNDIQGMIGKRSRFWNSFWSIMWRFITPAALVFILIFNWVEYKPAKYGQYVYPLWADIIGWIVGLLPVFIVFVVAFQQILNAPKHLTFKERIKFLLRPTAEWGPAGRPCVNLHAESCQTKIEYDVANTQILITAAGNSDDEDGNANGNRKETLLLGERASTATSIVVEVALETNERNEPTATVGKLPGPSMLKTVKQSYSQGTPEHSSRKAGEAKQLFMQSEPQKPSITKVLAAGTMSSGRECIEMSTFTHTAGLLPKTTSVAGKVQATKVPVNIAAVADTKPGVAAVVTDAGITKPQATKTTGKEIHVDAETAPPITTTAQITAAAATEFKSAAAKAITATSKPAAVDAPQPTVAATAASPIALPTAIMATPVAPSMPVAATTAAKPKASSTSVIGSIKPATTAMTMAKSIASAGKTTTIAASVPPTKVISAVTKPIAAALPKEATFIAPPGANGSPPTAQAATSKVAATTITATITTMTNSTGQSQIKSEAAAKAASKK